MQSVLKEIARQCSKISRILTKVSEKYPQVSAEVDLALFASIKIEKIISKHTANPSHSPAYKDSPESTQFHTINNYTDPIFDAAVRNIQSFKYSTSKLESKINILITESGNSQRPAPTRHKEEPRPPVKKEKKQIKHPQNQQSADESSKHLSEIDTSIIKLTTKIMTLMRQQEPKASLRPNQNEEGSSESDIVS